MPNPTFKATHPKLDVAGVCIAELTKAWDEYLESRKAYAEARLGFNWSHQGHREHPERASETISDAYDDYWAKMDAFKEAHAEYKTTIRELYRGHLL